LPLLQTNELQTVLSSDFAANHLRCQEFSAPGFERPPKLRGLTHMASQEGEVLY